MGSGGSGWTAASYEPDRQARCGASENRNQHEHEQVFQPGFFLEYAHLPMPL